MPLNVYLPIRNSDLCLKSQFVDLSDCIILAVEKDQTKTQLVTFIKATSCVRLSLIFLLGLFRVVATKKVSVFH